MRGALSALGRHGVRNNINNGRTSMKRVFAGSCMAALFAVSLAAQDPTTQKPSSSSQAAGADKTVTFTGCVKQGDSPSSFILANIKADEKEKGGAATGTTGAMAKAPDQVRLIASGDTKLSEHVGHQVTVTGTLSERGSSSPSAANPPAGGAPGAAGTSGSDRQPSLNVKTVSMVSSSCSQ